MNDQDHSPVMHDEDWIPDECPPAVAHLVANDQMLETMGLRGLASADSKAIAASMKRLREHLQESYERGMRDQAKLSRESIRLAISKTTLKWGIWGYVVGAASGAASVFLLAWLA